MQVNPTRVEEIFSKAVDQPSPAARAEFLAQACGQDTQLRQQVEALLAAHDAAGSFLKLSEADQTLDPTVPLSERPGNKIGRYKLLQQIGEGGFGVVFMAEQEQPVRRLVALKIIKLGMDTRQVVARFEAERQALAMMDHPNVAKVLDGGATETGRPYFVMELVKGTPITEYCNKNNLSIAKRLELFAQVCQAVQHAHQKGLIHRDIKPSNVLVSTHDDQAVPKVIDFGIAKAMAARLTEKTLFTEFRQLIGTPEYMSPEQAEGGLDIDTRSDVYSLGVLLYELLAGSPPFDGMELRSKAFEEMKRIIREVEPPTPSTRLGTLKETLPSIAAQRNIEPRKLASLVRGELDWIVMRCLEKDRKRRYQTANDLAQDIGRYLSDQPVEARAASRTYRLKKFIRRNKGSVLAGSAIAAALILGLALASIGFIQARRQAQIARTEAARSEQVARFLKDTLRAAGPRVAQGRDATLLREILDKTAERIGRDLKDQPEVEVNLRNTLGGVYLDLGEYQKAEAMQREALAIARSAWGSDHLYVAESLTDLADVHRRVGKFSESEALLREALVIYRKLLGGEHRDVADALDMLADVLRYEGKLDEAEPMERQALAMKRKLLGNENRRVGFSLNNLALMLEMRGKLAEAETMFREALAVYKKLSGEESLESAITLDNLARVLLNEGRLTEAEATYRETLAMRRKLLGNDHPKVADSLNKLARVLHRQGRPAEAESIFREGLAIQRKLQGSESFEKADLLNNLAYLLQRQGKLVEAEALSREALAMRRILLGNQHLWVADALAALTMTLVAEQKFTEAEPLARECLAIREQKAPNDWRTFNARSVLGGSLLGQKKYAQAEPLLLAGYEGMKQRENKIPAESTIRLNEALGRLVQLCEATNRSDQAAQWQARLGPATNSTTRP